jgi:hypothetical protein
VVQVVLAVAAEAETQMEVLLDLQVELTDLVAEAEELQEVLL